MKAVTRPQFEGHKPLPLLFFDSVHYGITASHPNGQQVSAGFVIALKSTEHR